MLAPRAVKVAPASSSLCSQRLALNVARAVSPLLNMKLLSLDTMARCQEAPSPEKSQGLSQQEEECLPCHSSMLLWTLGGGRLSKVSLPNCYIQPFCIQPINDFYTQEGQEGL